MKFEETADHIIFRETTIAQEMAQQYKDGMIVKTAEELEKADKRSQEAMPVTLMFDGHEDTRLVGFADIPKGIPSFRNGKIKRDIYYDKEVLTEEEIAGLRRAPLSEKKDLSIKFGDKTEYKEDVWNGIKVDGYSRDMDIQTLAWVEHGRCSTEDGCGLTRSDETITRYDSLKGLQESDKNQKTGMQDEVVEKEDPKCVSHKIKIFIKEGMDKEKARKAAIRYCARKDNVDRTDKEKPFMSTEEQTKTEETEETREDKDPILERLDALEASVSSLVTQLEPKADSDRADSEDCECDEERKDEESEPKEESYGKEIHERLDAIQKEQSAQKERIDNLPIPKIRRSLSIEDLNKHEQEDKT
jgi:hypothetical protein